MNRQAEGKVIKEIDQLKASVPSAERFSAIEPEMKALKAEKNTVWAQIKKIRGEEEVINKEMDKIKVVAYGITKSTTTKLERVEERKLWEEAEREGEGGCTGTEGGGRGEIFDA